MKKFFQVVLAIFFLVIVNNSYGVETTSYQISVDKIIEAPIKQIGLNFNVLVKNWDGNMPLDKLLVSATFADKKRHQEIYTDKAGRVSFAIPFCDKESSLDVVISLPDYPEIKSEVVTIVYIKHLKYFGFTHTAVTNFGGQEDYIEETSSFSNVALVQTSSTEEDIKNIRKVYDNGMLSIISVFDIFFETNPNEQGSQETKLRSNYLERWLEYAKEIEPYKEMILGFFVFDEPYWTATYQGKTFKEMKYMLSESSYQIKKLFPDQKIIGSFLITERELALKEVHGFPLPDDAEEYYSIPPELDLVAVFYYWSAYKLDYPDGGFSQFVNIWSERMQSFNKHLHSHQKMILIPGTFCFTQNKPTKEMEQELLDLAYKYYNFAKRNVKIVGIMPFLWPSYGNMIGAEEMEDLQKIWQDIGRKILEIE